MAKAKFIILKETESTNTYAAKVGALLPSGTVIATYNQTAGRGQRGNKWESEPGKNISFTAIVKGIKVAPAEQFAISETVSLAVVDVLSRYVPGISIKWSNDIYHGDSKLCGMLIEHSLSGNSIDRTIIGIGINVNQTVFRSDAPNPISLAQILGHELPLDDLLHEVGDEVIAATQSEIVNGEVLLGGKSRAEIHKRYLENLYRKDGNAHTFILPDKTEFEAVINDVQPDGKLDLIDTDNNHRLFYFKEIAFKIGK